MLLRRQEDCQRKSLSEEGLWMGFSVADGRKGLGREGKGRMAVFLYLQARDFHIVLVC